MCCDAVLQADAVAKVDKVRAAQSKQLNALESQATLNERKATLIEMNHELVDNCISVVNTYLAQVHAPAVCCRGVLCAVCCRGALCADGASV